MVNRCPASMRPARPRASAAAACTATARSKALSSVAASSPAASRDARPRRRRADAGYVLFCRQRLLDLGLEHGIEIGRRDRADQLVGDPAVATDQERLGHAV